jgi:hypothetical protein
MCKAVWSGMSGLLVLAATTFAQNAPYIGYVYPAGGQQGTTFDIRLGGQRLLSLDSAIVSGPGVTAEVTQFYRRLSNQELVILREQLKVLQQHVAKLTKTEKPAPPNVSDQIKRIQRRIFEYVNRAACTSHSDIAFVRVTIGPNAPPGSREIRLVTARGVSNPLVFHVGQAPEVSRKPMKTCAFQVLGKEHLAQRKRPPEEEEATVAIPCTMNGQIASGEVNRYRFAAKKGQRLVISSSARELIPYIADAVPGWFQPVISLHDATGKEVAFNDDFRFEPDPKLYYEVPADGEYVLSIADAIYRGREDFVYRVTVSEAPFITSVFPLGGRIGEVGDVKMDGWNLDGAKLRLPPEKAGGGIHEITAVKDGIVSNTVPFALSWMPEVFDQEPNDGIANAQKVQRPIVVNGRIDRPDDWDVFSVDCKAGQKIVAEVRARRLDSPVDSMLKITDAAGKILAINDDRGDPGSGLNTHHADSYLMFEAPTDGTYHVHLGETTRSGGPEYAYRLRISHPLPDFELRLVPSSLAIRGKGAMPLSVYAIRKDGFEGDIRLQLKSPADAFAPGTATLPADKEMIKVPLRTTLKVTEQPLEVVIVGKATVGEREIVRRAVAAEDRMQAFLWRHLVPAQQFTVAVFDPAVTPRPKRVPPELTEEEMKKYAPANPNAPAKFSQKQIAGRLRQLRMLYGESLLTDDFYFRKVAECQAAM